MRAYICFIGPPERDADWLDQGVEGVHRFLSRLWRLGQEVVERTAAGGPDPGDSSLTRKAHWAIDKVSRDIEHGFQMHTAIAAVMELVNDGYRLKDDLYGTPQGEADLRLATATAASLIFPFAPHLGAEVYEALEGERVWEMPWPKADPPFWRARGSRSSSR